jgi:hypothetical protein
MDYQTFALSKEKTMAKVEKITAITFRRTANVFINAGIVGLFKFMGRYNLHHSDKFPSLKISPLSNDELTVECDKLMEYLEEVYYFMGKEIYDTPSKKQLDENYNVYFVEELDTFKRFPKMNTYGLTHLLTNNAQGVTRKKENAPKIKQLEKDNPVLADKFKAFFESKKIKMLSKVYVNEPYTKITRLDIGEKFLQEGTKQCPIIGEFFKTLIESKNVSPFVSGLTNFNSFLNASEKLISWKAMYIIRFAPALCYYSYQNGYDTIICNILNSNNLQNIARLYETPMFREKEEMSGMPLPFQLNFRLKDFSVKRKGAEDININTANDTSWESEIAFMLLYTFYKDQFEGQIIDESEVDDNAVFDPFEDSPLDKMPISLVTFRADKFASTLRPNYYEEFNNVKYIMRLFYELESGEIKFQPVWQGLKLNSPKAQLMKKKSQTYSKGKAVERQIRASVLGKVLKGQTIIQEIEKLFYDSYKYLLAGEKIGFRNYKKLRDFLLLYEKSINFGNHKNMNENLQQRAIKLGKSLSYGILNFDQPKDDNAKKVNAKAGRKYIIRLHKARTIDQFTEALISIMKKYGVSVSNEILENLSKENFISVRQYAVIGALNGINSVLSSSQKN